MKFIVDYFNAEKSESLMFMGIGLLALCAGAYCWLALKTPFHRGLAVPLALIALIQMTVGTTVYFRSPKDLQRVEHMVQEQPSEVRAVEIPRMNAVMKNFVVYRYVELALLITGLVLLVLYRDPSFWRGLGIGLFIQSALMLSLDYFAEKRGTVYLKHLVTLAGTDSSHQKGGQQ